MRQNVSIVEHANQAKGEIGGKRVLSFLLAEAAKRGFCHERGRKGGEGREWIRGGGSPEGCKG
jgi:hypothetical protein